MKLWTKHRFKAGNGYVILTLRVRNTERSLTTCRLTFYVGMAKKRLADRESRWRTCRLTGYAGLAKKRSADGEGRWRTCRLTA